LGVLCSVCIALPITASAHLAQANYAGGTNGVGGIYNTCSTIGCWNHRDYNQVWHYAGREWGVTYQLTNDDIVAAMINRDNPTRWGGEIGYAKARCGNIDDDSGYTWTCQTTG
jgi:hypothetical protein